MVLVCERLEQRARAGGRRAAVRDPGGDPAGRSWARTAPALVAPMVHASARRCTALHYGTYDYSAACGIAAGVPEHGAPGGRPRQGGHAGRRRRHRRAALATARPTCCRSGDQAARTGGVAAARAAGAAVARARVLPGLGHAPGPAAEPLRRRRTRSTARGCRPRRPGCAPTSNGPGRAFLDEPATARRAGRLPGPRASTAAPTDSAEVEELSGVPPHRLAVLARRAAA